MAMSIQPASGAKDLNPQQVEINQILTTKLSKIYRQWGYEEISPPRVERLETLNAAGGIDSKEIVKIVSNESLGLRPEMTASIARMAATRFSTRPTPLRIWTTGTIYKSKQSIEGGVLIEEKLQSGVELFGVKDISAEMELLSLMLQAIESLELEELNCPTLLISHTSLMDLILSKLNIDNLGAIGDALSNQNIVDLDSLGLNIKEKEYIYSIQQCTGKPEEVLNKLKKYFNNNKILSALERLFNSISPIAEKHGIKIILDPTFQPHFKLYTGIIFQMVCKTSSSLVVIARGGRYDELVKTFSLKNEIDSGVGFSISIDNIRDNISSRYLQEEMVEKILIAFDSAINLEKAMNKQKEWHKKGFVALVELEACKDRREAELLINKRGCNKLDWIC